MCFPFNFSVEAPESVLRGQYFSIEVSSDVDWTMNRSPGFYFMDEYDVLRDDVEATFDASQTSLTFLVLDSERSDIALTITSGEDVWNATLPLSDSEEYMLVDGRRGLMDTDEDVMNMMDKSAVTYQIVLTKVDKVPKGEIETLAAKIEAKLKKRGAAHPVVLMTSSEKGWGIPELRAEIAGLI